MLNYEQFLENNNFNNKGEEVKKQLLLVVNREIFASYSEISKDDEQSVDSINHIERYLNLFEKEFGHEFLKKYVKENLDDLYDSIDDKFSAFTDLFFNKYDKTFPLSGFHLGDDEIGNLLKYVYGWHNTKYGKMAILDSFETMENYYNFLKNEMKNHHNAYNIVHAFDNVLIVREKKNSYALSLKEKDKGNLYTIESDIDKELKIHVLYTMNNQQNMLGIEINQHIVDVLIENNKFEYFAYFKQLKTNHLEGENKQKAEYFKKTGKEVDRFGLFD